MSSLRLSRAALLACLIALPAIGQTPSVDPERTAGPYVPTPQVIVDRMLEFGGIGAKDHVIDLGSGDGRIVITAAKKLGATGVGIEIDPELVERSNAGARKEGVEGRVSFRQLDIFKADISRATVLTLYVLPTMMTQLRPKVLAELRPGTRIVSHDYHFGDWLPDQRLSFQSQEKQQAVGFSTVSLYLWVVPANASGEWRIEAPEADIKAPVTLRLSQAFQSLTGRAELPAGAWEMNDMTLRGRDIRFTLPASGLKDAPRHVFRGRVDGATMQGEVELAGDRPRKVAWKATRVGAPTAALAR